MLDARFSQLYFGPLLKHAAALIACDSEPTYMKVDACCVV